MKPLRYLVVGGFNTAFAYFATVGLYYSLSKWLHIVVIGVLANIICITVSFATYKIFVFRSGAGWLHEYLRSYVVYGGSAVIGIAGLWILVDGLGIEFWLAQGGLMIIGVVISYIGHDRFTFKNRG
jgi:putative flippase GtrA